MASIVWVSQLIALVFGLIVFSLSVTLASVQGGNKWARYAAAATLFTLFHFAFLRLGLDYQGGAFALVGGAGVMGALWTVVAVKTRACDRASSLISS